MLFMRHTATIEVEKPTEFRWFYTHHANGAVLICQHHLNEDCSFDGELVFDYDETMPGWYPELVEDMLVSTFEEHFACAAQFAYSRELAIFVNRIIIAEQFSTDRIAAIIQSVLDDEVDDFVALRLLADELAKDLPPGK